MIRRFIRNNDFHSLLIFFIPVISLFIFFFIIEGDFIITGPADIYIGYYPNYANLMSYLDPYKLSNFGTYGNSGLAPLIFYFSNFITGNIAFTQHLIQLLPIIISYFSFWLFLGQIQKNKFYRLIFSDLYVFNAVALNQFTGATGLMYMYSFIPLFLYFLLRFYNNIGSISMNFTGSVFSIYFATFSSTETFFHVIMTAIPVLLFVILGIRRQLKEIYRLVRFFVFFVFSIAVAFLALSFTYLPWAEALMGISTPLSSSLIIASHQFIDQNFYLKYPGISVFKYPFSPLFAYAFINTPSKLILIIGIFSGILLLSSILPLNKNKFSVASIAFLLILTLYIDMVDYFPKYTFIFFLYTKPFSIILSGFPMVQEWWFVLVPWEIVSLYLGAINLPAFAKKIESRINKFKKYTQHKKLENKYMIRLYSKRKMIPKYLTLMIIILIISMAFYSNISNDYKSTSAYEKPEIINYFGNTTVTNHEPLYFEELQNNLSNEEMKSPFRVLYFPCFPIIKDTYSDLWAVSFPTSSSIVNSYVWTFLNSTIDNNPAKASSALSDLGIKYVVILKHLNEVNANPYMFYQGLIGNPNIAFNALNNNSYFNLVDDNSNYSLFLNNNFSFVHIYKADYTVPSYDFMGSNVTYNVSMYANSTIPNYVKNFNLVSFLNNNISQWTNISNAKMLTTGNRTNGNISIATSTKAPFLLSYYKNTFNAVSGQEYRLTYKLITGNNTRGVLYIGFKYYNVTTSKYCGVYNFNKIPLENNKIYNISSNAMLGNESNIFSITPLIALYSFNGSIKIDNLQFNFISEDNNTYKLPYTETIGNVSYLNTYLNLSNLYPYNNMLFTHDGELNNITDINLYYPNMKVDNRFYGIILPLKYYSNPDYGIINYNNDCTEMVSTSSLNGTIGSKNGNFTAVVSISGNPNIMKLQFNNDTKIISDSSGNIEVKFSVVNNSIIYNFTNYLGTAYIKSIIIYKGNEYSILENLSKDTSENNVSIKVSGDSFVINGNFQKNTFIVLPINFEPEWEITINQNFEELPIMANSWETGIYINQSGNLSINGKFEASTVYYVSELLQTGSFILLPALLALFYFIDKRRGR